MTKATSLIAAALLVAPPAWANESTTPEPKHGIFPLWGDWVREKGFELPEPFGVMVNYYYQKSKITITNLKLGVNDGPLRDATFIVIPEATTKASALAVRPSVMLLPFLSAYAVFSSGATETQVHISDPVDFTTTAKSGAQVLVIGGTFQAGYKGFFVVTDFNASVADVERLADTVGGNMLSFRLGYNYRLDAAGRSLAFWAGSAGQILGVNTEGSVRLSDVLPPPTQASVDNAQARCDALRPNDPRKQVCNDVVGKFRGWANGTDPTASVAYSLEKRPLNIWNMVLGAQYALDKNWHFRVESSFLGGRSSVLAGTEYRFDIR